MQQIIEFIATWLRQVVTVLILVRFVELVLPEGSIRRYARLVMGLVIMLAIVRPLLGLVTAGSGLLDVRLPGARAGGPGGAGLPAAPTAVPREAAGRALATITARQIGECQAGAVRRYVTERVRQLTGRPPLATDIVLDPGDGGAAAVGGIVVTLAPETVESAAAAAPESSDPRPVEPVVIGPVRPGGVDPGGAGSSVAAEDAPGPAAAVDADDPAAAAICARVRDALSVELGLAATAVTVRVASGSADRASGLWEEADGR